MRENSITFRRAPLHIFILGLFATLILVNARPGQAQGADNQAVTPKVKEVYGPLALNQEIMVEVDNLPALLKKVNGDLSKIVLHVDGYPLTGLVPRRLSVGGGEVNKLIYDLRPPADEEQRNAWHALLGRPKLFPPEPKKVSVSVGEKGQPVEPKNGAELRVINKNAFWVFLIALAALIIAFYYMATQSDLLRDSGPDPWTIDGNGQKVILRKPYSLARTQMALWFFVVFASYLFIWLVTGALVSLTAQVLGLIGISAGTAMGAAVIDTNKQGALERQKEDLEKKRNSLESDLASLQSQITAVQQNVAPAVGLSALMAEQSAKKTTLDQVKTDLAKLESGAEPLKSDWFLVDILSDEYGVSFHRFQILAWTLALIVIFIASVYRVLTIPPFDGTLLALMGISSGAYLGLKLPETRIAAN
jgi:hypothetical protein